MTAKTPSTRSSHAISNALTLIVTAIASLGLQSIAADADKTLTRIHFGSCIKQDQPMPIFTPILNEKPELFIFLGDNIYADTKDMDVMRAKYAKLAANEGFAKLRHTSRILATWDDHDYGLNDAGSSYPKKREAQAIFNDFWKTPKNSPRRQRPGIYDVATFGPTGKRVQVILLDTRYFRGKLKTGERRVGGPYYPDNNPAIPMLGKTQWAWLERQLQQPADLRIIATSIQCIPEASGQETWSNLPRERQRLFQLIKKTKANGVVFISGDRHWSELSKLEGAANYPLYELTSSSLNQPHKRGTPTQNRHRTDAPTWHKVNYGVIEIDWKGTSTEITLEIRDIEGTAQIQKKLRLIELQPKQGLKRL